MKKLTILLFFIALKTSAECMPEVNDQNQIESLIDNFNRLNIINCDEIRGKLTKEQSMEILKLMAEKQKLKLGHDQNEVNRHEIGKRLNRCTADKNDKALIINFEGTGSFSPRTTHLMLEFSKCVGPAAIKEYFHYRVGTILKDVYGEDDKWSALSSGPLSLLATNDATKNVNWVTFASEESEILAEPTDLKSFDIISGAIYPRGVQAAIDCIENYLIDAQNKNVKPKIIVQGHSSGSRSTVKFIEKLKTFRPPIQVDLMLTIDPVKEAHLAVKEVGEQMAGNASREVYNAIPILNDKKILPPNVWTRNQPSTLYKPSNVTRSISFYQNVDKEGIKGPVKFGIHGSPIHNADRNYFIDKGLGTDAHGAIATHEKTKEEITKEYKSLNLLP